MVKNFTKLWEIPVLGGLEWNNREIADGKVTLLLIELSSDRAQKSPHFVNLHIL